MGRILLNFIDTPSGAFQAGIWAGAAITDAYWGKWGGAFMMSFIGFSMFVGQAISRARDEGESK
jgi:hypothetical protein